MNYNNFRLLFQAIRFQIVTQDIIKSPLPRGNSQGFNTSPRLKTSKSADETQAKINLLINLSIDQGQCRLDHVMEIKLQCYSLISFSEKKTTEQSVKQLIFDDKADTLV